MKIFGCEPTGVAFFQAVRYLERAPGAPRVGREGPASKEVLRLRPSLSLAFAPSDIEGAESLPATAERPARARLTTRFLGLYGVTSPLPTHYSERLWENVTHEGQTRLREFLDIFHHRLLSFLYRSWTRHHYIVEYLERW